MCLLSLVLDSFKMTVPFLLNPLLLRSDVPVVNRKLFSFDQHVNQKGVPPCRFSRVLWLSSALGAGIALVCDDLRSIRPPHAIQSFGARQGLGEGI